MGFLLLLSLSLGGLLRVNINSAESQEALIQAKQNALLALSVACGELQQYAGPDQRTTARGDIRGAEVANPYWTGVWDKAGNLLTYLVSGNENSTTPVYTETSALVAGSPGAVALVSEKNAGAGNGVLVPLVNIGTDSGDGYAYWIGDEGVKAKVNLAPATPPSGSAKNVGLLVPQHFAFSNIADFKDWFDPATWFEANGSINPLKADQVKRLMNIDSLGYLKNSSLRQHIHDVTADSYGVLSDPQKGGLKKDLTVALGGESIHPDLAGKSVFSGGPLWDQVHSWVNTTADSSGLPVRGASNARVGIYPVIAGFHLYFVPTYDETIVGDKTMYTISNNVVPAVALWNPYDKKLETKNYRLIVGRKDVSKNDEYLENLAATDGTNGIRIAFLTDPNQNKYGGHIYDGTFVEIDNNFNASSQSYDAARTFEFVISNVSLDPGEVKVYSPAAGGAPFSTHPRVLAEGLNYHGYSTPIYKDGTTEVPELYQNTDGSPINFYRIWNPPTQAGAIQLLTESGELLTDALYLNLAANGSVPRIEMQRTPTGGNQLDLGKGYGWIVVRDFGENNRRPLADHSERLQLNVNHKWLGNYNPRAVTSGPHPVNYTVNANDFRPLTTQNPSYISAFDRMMTGGMALEQHVNDLEAKALPAKGSIILFESSPGIQNIFTIGQLSHAPLFYWDDSYNGTNYSAGSIGRVVPRMKNSAFDNLIPAYPIGNSRSNPVIPLGETSIAVSTLKNPNTSYNYTSFLFGGTLYDYSYLLNESLWDGYFFSSAEVSSEGGQGSPAYTLRNPRMVSVPGTSLEPGVETTARGLLVDGAFNINSTSVNAWNALLSSFYGREPGSADRVRAAASAEGVEDTRRAPFLRVSSHEAVVEKQDPGIYDEEAYTGYRALSAEQIRALATAIVQQIRQRGPATTLAAFINRSLSAEDDALRVQGALSAAIENAGSINSNLSDVLASDADFVAGGWKTVDSKYQSATAAKGYVTEGLPGWLTAADIFSRLGSVLASRSDTFVIRAYGESGTGNSSASAWCEAVVQRVPHLAVSEAVSVPPDEPQPIDFGRRFVIVSFRWLSEEDI